MVNKKKKNPAKKIMMNKFYILKHQIVLVGQFLEAKFKI